MTVPAAGRDGIGLEVLHLGHQQDHFEQQIQALMGARGYRHHHGIAAPVLGQQSAIGQLLLDAVGLRLGLIDLVDRHDNRHPGRLGVVDRFQSLRHDAVIRRHHQDHDIGDLGAASAHAGERFVTRGVDEDDLLVVQLHLVGADVLGDAAGLAPGDVGFADRIEDGGFAVIHVAHDGDHRSAPDLVLGVFRLLHRLHGFGLVADGGGGRAEIARHLGGQLRIERLVDGDKDALVHQLLHHQRGLHVQLLGEFLHRDAFGNRDLAVDRRRSGFYLPAVLRTQDLLFVTAVALRSALAGTLSRSATTGSGRIGRRRRQTRLHAARTRYRMLRARSARTARGHTRTHARPGHHRLAGTDRSAVDRLAGYRRRRRLRNTGARRYRGRRHGGPRRGELGRKIGTRWNHRTRCRLTGQGPLLLREPPENRVPPTAGAVFATDAAEPAAAERAEAESLATDSMGRAGADHSIPVRAAALSAADAQPAAPACPGRTRRKAVWGKRDGGAGVLPARAPRGTA